LRATLPTRPTSALPPVPTTPSPATCRSTSRLLGGVTGEGNPPSPQPCLLPGSHALIARSVPGLTPFRDGETAEALKGQAARQLAGSDSGYVFTKENGAPLYPQTVSRSVEQALCEAKLPRSRSIPRWSPSASGTRPCRSRSIPTHMAISALQAEDEEEAERCGVGGQRSLSHPRMNLSVLGWWW
jgi:hypothetical protein